MAPPLIPKFSNFKPKAKVKVTDDTVTRVAPPSASEQHRETEKSRKTHSSIKRPHGNQRQDADDNDDNNSDLFVVDRRGDPKNVEFGSLHRYSIPLYHSSGHGRALGLSGRYRIDREEGNDRENVLSVYRRAHSPERLLSSKDGKPAKQAQRFLRSYPAHDDDEMNLDYLSFSPGRKRKRGSASPGSVHGMDYRSIQGKAKEDDSQGALTEASANDDEEERSLRLQDSALGKKAKADPNDVNSWLVWAEHQQKLVRPDKEVPAFSSSERRLLANLRIDILRKAGKAIEKRQSGRERILLAIIEEGRYVWDSQQLEIEWKAIHEELPSNSMIWTKYLNYIQSSHRSFDYEKCKEAFIKCLDVLKEACEDDPESASDIHVTQVYVILRLTALIRDSGYGELALAVWQGVLQQRCDDQSLDSLGQFWDSEKPRLGEDKEGHENIITYPDNRSTRRQSRRSRYFRNEKQTSIDSFASKEACLSEPFNLPVSLHDVNDSDPHQCVIFSDLRPILEAVILPLPWELLTNGFLCFSRLPPPPQSAADQKVSSWWKDPFLNVPERLFTCSENLLRSENVKCRNQIETVASIFEYCQILRTHLATSRDETGIEPNLDELECKISQHVAGQLRFANTNRPAAVIDGVLDILVQKQLINDRLAEYYLACKHVTNPPASHKAVKKLVKNHPSNLRLYNIFAMMHAVECNMDQAKNVWDTALSMRQDFGAQGLGDAIILRHSAASAYLQRQDEATALLYLFDVPADKFDPVALLAEPRRISEARRDFEIAFHRMLLDKKPYLAVLNADCFGWMTYLGGNHDLSAACTAFNQYCKVLQYQAERIGHELLLQSKAKILQYHIDARRPYRPATLIDELDQEIRLFPNNSVLLDLRSRLASQDRLRALVREQKSNTTATELIPWSFKLSAELRRLEADFGGSTANSVRQTFSNALRSDSSLEHAPFFWQCWFGFECQHGNLQKAKQVFYDGVMKLPWHKMFIVNGMNFFSEEGRMSEKELRQLQEVLMERGLRIRTEIVDTENDVHG